MTTPAQRAPLIVGTSSQDEGDDVLVRRLANGDADAGDVLVDRYSPQLLGYLRKLCGSDAVAEELHQAAWLSVLEHLDQFDPSTAANGGAGFKAWLFRIATNKAHDHHRRGGRDRNRNERLGRDPTWSPANAAEAPTADLERSEQAEELRQAMQALPEAQREVVMLRYFGGLKFNEIAETLGCPLNTALGRMHKAMQKLKVALGAEERQ